MSWLFFAGEGLAGIYSLGGAFAGFVEAAPRLLFYGLIAPFVAIIKMWIDCWPLGLLTAVGGVWLAVFMVRHHVDPLGLLLAWLVLGGFLIEVAFDREAGGGD